MKKDIRIERLGLFGLLLRGSLASIMGIGGGLSIMSVALITGVNFFTGKHAIPYMLSLFLGFLGLGMVYISYHLLSPKITRKEAYKALKRLHKRQ